MSSDLSSNELAKYLAHLAGCTRGALKGEESRMMRITLKDSEAIQTAADLLSTAHEPFSSLEHEAGGSRERGTSPNRSCGTAGQSGPASSLPEGRIAEIIEHFDGTLLDLVQMLPDDAEHAIAIADSVCYVTDAVAALKRVAELERDLLAALEQRNAEMRLRQATERAALRHTAESPCHDWSRAPADATHYQPHQRAYYKRISATEWFVWSRLEREPHSWMKSPGTCDNSDWIKRPSEPPSGLRDQMWAYLDAIGAPRDGLAKQSINAFLMWMEDRTSETKEPSLVQSVCDRAAHLGDVPSGETGDGNA